MAVMSDDDLRAIVREILGDVRPQLAQRAERRPVCVDTDADLASLVATILDLSQDPAGAARLRNGQVSFTLSARATEGSAPTEAPAPVAPINPVRRIEKGAVTEKVIVQAANSGTKLVLGRGAVLTPLAREKARSLRVEIERAS